MFILLSDGVRTMIIELLIGAYCILSGLGFYTDLQLSKATNNKYYWFSIPLTAPIIGLKLLLEKIKRKPNA
jgi:hypothetical protein